MRRRAGSGLRCRLPLTVGTVEPLDHHRDPGDAGFQDRTMWTSRIALRNPGEDPVDDGFDAVQREQRDLCGVTGCPARGN